MQWPPPPPPLRGIALLVPSDRDDNRGRGSALCKGHARRSRVVRWPAAPSPERHNRPGGLLPPARQPLPAMVCPPGMVVHVAVVGRQTSRLLGPVGEGGPQPAPTA